jgi:transcriptional regulator with PAS, ATPase and Fis domain
VIERALILETKVEIQPENLPDFQLEARLHKSVVPKAQGGGSLDEIMSNFERELIGSMLEQNHYNLGRTAEQLRISRHALRYRMQRLNIALDVEDETTTVSGKDQPK